jgi:site-specific recombinase XerD
VTLIDQQKEDTSLKIKSATEGLTTEYYKLLNSNKISKENASTIANYILSMKNETNLSDNYRRAIIKTLSPFSVYNNNNKKSFRSMTRQDLLSYLDSFRKPESVDPMHKWIGTYNLYI